MKKITLFLIIFSCFISVYSYAKYSINYNLECFDIIVEKDREPPQYSIEYSSNSWTNEDVVVKVKFSEEIKGLDGFKFYNGYYIKTCNNNEKNQVKVLDLAGNETIFCYEVNWIDKQPPIIEGIENNATYFEEKYVKYFDNQSGIKKIEKRFYGDLLIGLTKEKDDFKNNTKIHILRHPKNIKEYKYYRVESNIENYILSNKENIVFNNIDFIENNYYVIATDNYGNIYKSNLISEANYETDISKYTTKENDETFSKSGIYDIDIFDNAGNEISYTIKIDL